MEIGLRYKKRERKYCWMGFFQSKATNPLSRLTYETIPLAYGIFNQL